MITITPLKTIPLKYSHFAHFPHPCGRAGLFCSRFTRKAFRIPWKVDTRWAGAFYLWQSSHGGTRTGEGCHHNWMLEQRNNNIFNIEKWKLLRNLLYPEPLFCIQTKRAQWNVNNFQMFYIARAPPLISKSQYFTLFSYSINPSIHQSLELLGLWQSVGRWREQGTQGKGRMFDHGGEQAEGGVEEQSWRNCSSPTCYGCLGLIIQ